MTRASVTRLERFASCSYAHFLAYGLRLSEREYYQFESIDLGNIAHQAMERYARRIEKDDLDWVLIPEEVRSMLIEESVEESIVDYGNTVLYSTARNEYIITRIKQLLKRSVWALTKQLENSDFRPSKFEMKFGSGKIDRVDLCEDDGTVYVKVIDYKTGSRKFDITALYYGLQMQLPVYMNAAMDIMQKQYPQEEVVPAGIFYYRIQDPFVEKVKNESMLEESMLEKLKLDGIVNADKVVLEHLERNLEGSSKLLPISRNKSGSLSAASKALDPATFLSLLDYIKVKEAELKEEIASGRTEAAPYVLGNHSGCEYCAYRDICRFDTEMEGFEYRNLEKHSLEVVMSLIQGKLEEE